MRAKTLCAMLLVLLMTSCSALTRGGDYPSGDIDFIVPYGPGGSADPMGRAFTRVLEEDVGESMVIRNRPGAAATVGTTELLTADSDGYTVGMTTNSALVYYPVVKPDLPWKTANDYQPLAKIVEQAAVLAVKKDSPWQTFEDFVEAAKKRPGELKVASQGRGSTSDLIMREFIHEAGVDIQMVPFSEGSGQSESALFSGRVDANVTMPTSAKPEVSAGRMKVIGVFQDGKMPLYPDATPVNDIGYDIDLRSVFYFVAPKGIPDDARTKLVDASNHAVESKSFKEFAESNGGRVEKKSPDQVKAELRSYEPTYRKLIEQMGDG